MSVTASLKLKIISGVTAVTIQQHERRLSHNRIRPSFWAAKRPL